MFSIPNFTETHPVRVALIHTETKTDGHDAAKTLFVTTRTLLKSGNASVDKNAVIKTSDSIHTFRTSHKKDMTSKKLC